MKKPLPPAVKIAAIAGAMLLVVLLAIQLLMTEGPGEEAMVEARVQELVSHFERRRTVDFVNMAEFPLPAPWRRDDGYTKSDLTERLDAVFQQLAYIAIRIQETEVTMREDGTALVRLSFHWTVSNSMYPNARARSENYNPRSEPEVAELIFEKQNDEWVLVEIGDLSRN